MIPYMCQIKFDTAPIKQPGISKKSKVQQYQNPVPRFALVGKSTSFDATAYAFLANIIFVPLDSALKQHALKYPRLEAYCRLMRERYYP